MAALLDLVALEAVEEGSGRLLTLARGRDRPFRCRERASVCALPGHFQDCRVTAGESACHRACGVRERLLPTLEDLHDLLRTLDLPLGPQLVVAGVGGEPCSHALPVAVVEGLHLLARDLDHLVCRLDLGKKYG